MNRAEFMAKLRDALAGLPEEERMNALRYYEEYFDDAEDEAKAIADLGSPEKVAAQILAEYRELIPVTPSASPSPKRWKGISPWLLALLVLLAIPIGIPLAVALGGVLLAILAVLASVLLAIVIVAFVLPLVLVVGGGALIVFSFFVWRHPASALVTLGSGLAAAALGVLALLLVIKLCTLFVPPLVRGVVALLRKPIDYFRKKGGTNG